MKRGGGDLLLVFCRALGPALSADGSLTSLNGNGPLPVTSFKGTVSKFFCGISLIGVRRKGGSSTGGNRGPDDGLDASDETGLAEAEALLKRAERSSAFWKFGGANGAGCPSFLLPNDGISILISSIEAPENALARMSGMEGAEEGDASPGAPLPVRKAGSSDEDAAF